MTAHATRTDRPSARTSGRRRRVRPAAVLAVVLLGALAVGVVALTVGDFPLSVPRVLAVLVGRGDGATRLIVLELRAPRVLVGLLAGAGLALAGALTQTVVRNPLASPDILGVTSGASLGAVAAIVGGGGTYEVSDALLRAGVPLCAAVGGLAAATLVVGLSWRRGLAPTRLVLVGVGLASAVTALTSWLLVVAKVNDATTASVWLAGSVSSRGWAQAVPLAIALAVLVPAGLALARPLSVLELGDEVAAGLGLRVRATAFAAAAVAVCLTAAAVSAAGAIGFVGLVVPQIMLRLAGTTRPPLAASAAGGALLVGGADLAERLLFSWEVPVGLATAALGAPYLIWLLIRQRRTA